MGTKTIMNGDNRKIVRIVNSIVNDISYMTRIQRVRGIIELFCFLGSNNVVMSLITNFLVLPAKVKDILVSLLL